MPRDDWGNKLSIQDTIVDMLVSLTSKKILECFSLPKLFHLHDKLSIVFKPGQPHFWHNRFSQHSSPLDAPWLLFHITEPSYKQPGINVLLLVGDRKFLKVNLDSGIT